MCPSDARIKPRQSQKFAVASNHPTTQYAREGFPAGARDYLRAWVRVRPRTYWGRMMPEKILARGPRVLADSQLAPGQEAIGVG